MSRAFFTAYIGAEPIAETFLPREFSDPRKRHERVRQAALRKICPEIAEYITDFNAGLPSSEARGLNVRALSRGGAAAIVTGQQVGLFLGPLYSFYKAATAIQLARLLSAETGTTCVPVFWLQTEDHDFAEINHCYVYDGSAQTPIKVELPSGAEADERVSVKQRIIGPQIEPIFEKLEERLGQFTFTAPTMDLLRQCYREGELISQAFARLMTAVFAEEGLVVFDPRDPRVTALVKPIFRKAIDDCALISDRLTRRADALRREGFHEQVPVRENCSLVFFHRGGASGARFRLERKGDTWTLAGVEDALTDEQVRSALNSEPFRFSTSALLRPIVQDFLLPTAACVGGPGEVGYFAQLPPLYETFGLGMPLVVPRARFRLLDHRSSDSLVRLGLDAQEIGHSLETLVAQADADTTIKPGQLEETLLAPFLERLSRFERDAGPLDRAVQKGVARTKATVTKAVTRLKGRYLRAITERNETTRRRVQSLQNFLFPEGMPQERFYSFVSFACKYGIHHLKKAVLDSVDPFQTEVRNIRL